MTGNQKSILKSLLIMAIGCLSLFATDALRLPDQGKPLYQKQWGGTVIAWPAGDVDEVAWPKPAEVVDVKKQLKIQSLRHDQEMKEQAANHKSNQHAWGSIAIAAGWILIALGGAAHFATSVPLVKSASSSIITLGGFTVVGGLGMQMTVEYDFFLKCGLLVLVVGWITYRLYKHRELHLPDEMRAKYTDIRNATKPRPGTKGAPTKKG